MMMKRKKSMLMAALVMTAIVCTTSTSCNQELTQEEYLKKMLTNVEKIKVAEYEITEKVKAPYEKKWSRIFQIKKTEHDNPADTTLGFSCVEDVKAEKRVLVYDGTLAVTVDNNDKTVTVKDFQDKRSKSFPHRPYWPPFFNYVKSLMRYMLTTTDSIQLVREETEEDYIYKLSIYEDQQVEFFGRDYKVPRPPFSLSEEDGYSFYTLWIRKADAMPYRYLREMSHNVQDITCHLTSWSDQPAKEPIVATNYIPKEGYEVHFVGKEEQKKKGPSVEERLVGQPAPDWTLKDIDGKEVSLKSLRGKPTIINLTGLGCGPCALSYPELVEMSKRFNVVSIEAWGNKVQSLIDYVEHHKITYPFLPGNDEVLDAYVGGDRGVPVYFYLDKNHIIRKVDRGYNHGHIAKNIKELGWE